MLQTSSTLLSSASPSLLEGMTPLHEGARDVCVRVNRPRPTQSQMNTRSAELAGGTRARSLAGTDTLDALHPDDVSPTGSEASESGTQASLK